MSRTVVLALAGTVLFGARSPAQQSYSTSSGESGIVSNSQSEQPGVGLRDPLQQFAEQAISTVRLQVPHKARELYEKARRAFGKHQYVEAQKRLHQALQVYSAFPEALTMLGYIQVCLSQTGRAEQSLQAAARSDPSYALAHIVLADLYNTEQRFDDALASAQQAIMLISDSWVAQFEMARAFLGKGQYDLAVNISDAALRTKRGTFLHVLKAHALIGLGRYPEAATELRTYLEYQPGGDLSQDARDLLHQIQGAVASR